MKIIALNKNNVESVASQCADSILAGNLVIAPFDTVYGFLCDPKDDKCLNKIFKLKKRKFNKTIGLTVTNIDIIAQLTDLNQTNKKFIAGKIPGPYTFILPTKNNIGVSSQCIKDNNLGIRVPDNKLIHDISEKCDGYLAQTSANVSGEQNCYSLAEIVNQFHDDLDDVDLIIDGGKIVSRGSSEIYDLTGKTAVKIER